MRSRTGGMWWGTAIEAPAPGALARFYAELLEWPIVHEEPGTTVVAPPQGSVHLVFQQATGYRPPAWPPADRRAPVLPVPRGRLGRRPSCLAQDPT